MSLFYCDYSERCTQKVASLTITIARRRISTFSLALAASRSFHELIAGATRGQGLATRSRIEGDFRWAPRTTESPWISHQSTVMTLCIVHHDCPCCEIVATQPVTFPSSFLLLLPLPLHMYTAQLQVRALEQEHRPSRELNTDASIWK